MIDTKILEKARALAIYGNVGSGKTALVYAILSQLKGLGKEIYFYRHPRAELIEALGYKNIIDIGKLEQIQDSVIYIDEPQLYFTICNKKSNDIIAKFCSLARQRDNILIISSSDTRCFTKHNESYFDLWMIKQLDLNMVKQGSLIKEIIRNNSYICGEGFSVDVNEFLAYSKNLEISSRYTFDLPEYFTENHSKPYKIPKEKCAKIEITGPKVRQTLLSEAKSAIYIANCAKENFRKEIPQKVRQEMQVDIETATNDSSDKEMIERRQI